MHRTEGLDHVANMFDPGDPALPRFGTELEFRWSNSVQEELAKTIEAAGLTVRNAADDIAAGYGGQLLEAIRALNPIKAWAKLRISTTPGSTLVTVDAGYGVASAAVVEVATGFWKGVRVDFASTFGTPRPTKRVIEAAQISNTTNVVRVLPTEAWGVYVYDQPSPPGGLVTLADNQVLLSDMKDNLGAAMNDLRGLGTVLFVVAYA